MPSFKGSSSSRKLVLRGRIVTLAPAGVLPDGAICILEDRIHHVLPAGDALPPMFKDAPIVNTDGTIFPGLIELHNHLSYNYLPLWQLPRRFTNRNDWRTQEPDYDIRVAWPATLIGKSHDIDFPRSVARYVECRSLLGGVTTTQGLSSSSDGSTNYYEGLLRNVEAPTESGFPRAAGQTLDFSPGDIALKLVPALKKDFPFFYHLSEGTDSAARQRFLDLEYQAGTWAIDRDLVAIHCTALEKEDFGPLRESGGMVWSPLSNFLLYGATADVEAARAYGVKIALGSDWSPSGSKNILGELKIAQAVSNALGGVFSDEDIVRMVTSSAAEIVQWDGQVGTIEANKKADLLVLEGSTGSPYAQLIQAREDKIVAVLIDGRPRLARQELAELNHREQELIRVGGQVYVLDLVEAGRDPLAGLSLATATSKLKDGLSRLPELARELPRAFSLMSPLQREATVAIDLELDDDPQARAALAFAPGGIDPDRVVPLRLPPLTEVDDADFCKQLRANINLPGYLREMLGRH